MWSLGLRRWTVDVNASTSAMKHHLWLEYVTKMAIKYPLLLERVITLITYDTGVSYKTHLSEFGLSSMITLWKTPQNVIYRANVEWTQGLHFERLRSDLDIDISPRKVDLKQTKDHNMTSYVNVAAWILYTSEETLLLLFSLHLVHTQRLRAPLWVIQMPTSRPFYCINVT